MVGGSKKILLVLPLLLCFFALPLTVGAGEGEKEIVIELSNFKLFLYQEGETIRDYPIAIGAPGSPTPVGKTEIVRRVRYPTYYPPGWGEKGLSPVAPGPDNPVGTRWLDLSWPYYGIHGTNNSASIGNAVSAGCIRMFNEDIEELFELVRVGTPVIIVQKKEGTKSPREQETKLDSELEQGWFLVQAGAFEYKENALQRQKELKAAGYTAEISGDNLFLVRLTEHFPWHEAKIVQGQLEKLGFSVLVRCSLE